MKQLLTAILLIFSIGVFAQTPTNPYTSKSTRGNVNTLDSAAGPITTGVGLINKAYYDTTAANAATKFKTYPGSQIYTYSDKKFWLSDGFRWFEISGGSSNACTYGLDNGTGIVSWDSGFHFSVSSASYHIPCKDYVSLSDTITLDASDPSLPRIDVIVVDTNSNVVILKGTPATNPSPPTIDVSSQVYLTFILVPAGATQPAGVTNTVLWDENLGSPSEYVASATGLTVNFNGTTTPYHLTKAADVGAFTNNDVISFNGLGHSSITYNTLVCYIKLKSALANTANISVRFNGSAQTALPIVKNLVGVYQNISIPIPTSILSTDSITGIDFVMNGANTSGFYLDYISLKGGTSGGGGSSGDFVTQNSSRNDTLFYRLNGIDYPFYHVAASASDTVVTKFPLITVHTMGQHDSLTIVHGDSLFYDVVRVSDSLFFYRENGTAKGVYAPIGGSGNTNSNIGSGYRLAVPNTNNIKTLFFNAPLIADSTSNTNAITVIADTTKSVGRIATYSDVVGKLDTAATYVNAGAINWPGTLYTSPTNGVVTGHKLSYAPTLATQSGKYVLTNPSTSTGLPSFSPLDSSWLAGMHTQGYYDGRYAAINAAAWTITGNAGTDGGTTNFIGTTDNKALMFRTNNVNAVNISAPNSYGSSLTVYGATSSNAILRTTSAYGELLLGAYGSYSIYKANGDILGGMNVPFTFYGNSTGDNLRAIRSASSGAGNIFNCKIGTVSDPDVFSVYVSNSGEDGTVMIGKAGSAANKSSTILDLRSTTKGVLIPRMTTTQKNAIASPAEGLEVYDLTLHQKSYYNGSTWINY